MKSKYTYQTDTARLRAIKLYAISEGVPTNKIIDRAIDSLLQSADLEAYHAMLTEKHLEEQKAE